MWWNVLGLLAAVLYLAAAVVVFNWPRVRGGTLLGADLALQALVCFGFAAGFLAFRFLPWGGHEYLNIIYPMLRLTGSVGQVLLLLAVVAVGSALASAGRAGPPSWPQYPYQQDPGADWPALPRPPDNF